MSALAKRVICVASERQAWEARRRRGVRRTVLVVTGIVLAIFALSLLQGLSQS